MKKHESENITILAQNLIHKLDMKKNFCVQISNQHIRINTKNSYQK
jgi:hypothetical protein